MFLKQMRQKNAFILKIIVVGCLPISYTNPLYSQSRARTLYKSATSALAGATSKLASSASQKIKGGLSSAFQKLKSMDRTVVVSRLEKEVERLGGKIGYMANCMIKGSCKQSERAAFIAASVSVLALTMVVVGVTLSVAATSQEVERVTKVTTQEVEGWGPSEIFQRLRNSINNYKRSLSELKEGILKRQLTRGQKKFLYSTALSIAALVTLAVGIGIASYVYAEKKEAQRQREAAEAPEAASAPVTPGGLTLEQLAQQDEIQDVQPAQGAFGQLFDRVVSLQTQSANAFSQATTAVRKKLAEKSALAQRALQAAGQERERLAKEAQAAYAQALQQANNLMAQVKASGTQFIKEAIRQLFAINYDDIKSQVSRLKNSLDTIRPSLAELATVPTWQDLERVQRNWYAVQQKGYALWNNLTDFLRQLAGRKKTREGWWGLVGLGTEPAEESREKRAELMRDYPLAYKFDALRKIYPQLLQSIAATHIPAAGNAAQKVLSNTGQTLQEIATLHQSTGNWGKLIVPAEMQSSLDTLGTSIKRVGKSLQEFTQGEPLKELSQQFPQQLEEAPLREWFGAMIWRPADTIQRIKEILTKLTPQMLEANKQLQRSLQQSVQLSETFTQHSIGMLTLIQQTIAQQLQQQPFQNYINVAKQAVAKEAKISKDLFNDLILHTAGIVNYLNKLIMPFVDTVSHLNELLQREFLSAGSLEKLRETAENLNGMRDELARLREIAKLKIQV